MHPDTLCPHTLIPSCGAEVNRTVDDFSSFHLEESTEKMKGDYKNNLAKAGSALVHEDRWSTEYGIEARKGGVCFLVFKERTISMSPDFLGGRTTIFGSHLRGI